MADLPRPVLHPAPARRWSPGRPGDFAGPADVPWGGVFGTTGPDAGFAITLVRRRGVEPAPGEDVHSAEQVIAALAAARASRFGRAPMSEDIDLAFVVLGYDSDGLPEDLMEDLVADRARWLAGVGHNVGRVRDIVADVPIATLDASPEEARAEMAAGKRLISR